jgi:hypothetical protein
MGGGTIPPIAETAMIEAEEKGIAKRFAYSIRRREILWIRNERRVDEEKLKTDRLWAAGGKAPKAQTNFLSVQSQQGSGKHKKHRTEAELRLKAEKQEKKDRKEQERSDKHEKPKKQDKREKSPRPETFEDESKKRRDFAVREMYPRILFAFSDVIVYVLVNVKYENPRLSSS